MTRRLILALFILACLAPASPASADLPAPAWKLSAIQVPTNFIPGAEAEYFFVATDVGSAPTAGPITLEVELPAGLVPTAAVGNTGIDPQSPIPSCQPPVGQQVTCTASGSLPAGRWLGAMVKVDVAPALAGTVLETAATISGGGAPSVSTLAPTTVDSQFPPFGFAPGASGFGALLTNPGPSPATAGGTHPGQLTVNVGFPLKEVDFGGGALAAVEHPRNLRTDLPPGLIVDPTSTPVLCTEVQLTSYTCPPASQIGVINTMTGLDAIAYTTEPLYNMVPPAGAPAQLGFDALGVGIFVHITGGVRSDGDYGISSLIGDLLAYPVNPILGATAQIWGDPSSSAHDQLRGTKCLLHGGACPVEPTETAALTMPTRCSGPLGFTGAVDSWEQPGLFHQRDVQSADTAGTPTGVEGCNALDFTPSIEATPTTNLADSPSGLDFHLHQPQNTKLEELSTAALKDAVVAFPPGLVANPSQADGLATCSTTQIGLATEIGATPIHFSKQPQSCPDAAKIGSLEVKTPLLGQYSEDGTVLQTDPEGNAIPRPLSGAVYLAEPFANPFGSLLAVYLSIEDPQSGTVAKFAVRVKADPQTGQLTNLVSENPQLPLEDVTLHLFGGPRASLTSPPTCGTHTTTSTLTPWSSPEGQTPIPPAPSRPPPRPDGGAAPPQRPRPPTPPLRSRHHQPPGQGLFPLRLEALPPRRLRPPDQDRHPAAPGSERQAGRSRAVRRGRDRPGGLEEQARGRHPRAGTALPAPPHRCSAQSTSAPAPAPTPSTPPGAST